MLGQHAAQVPGFKVVVDQEQGNEGESVTRQRGHTQRLPTVGPEPPIDPGVLRAVRPLEHPGIADRIGRPL